MAQHPGTPVTLLSLGLGCDYVCTLGAACPFEGFGVLLGLPGQAYTCECGAPMQEKSKPPTPPGSAVGR